MALQLAGFTNKWILRSYCFPSPFDSFSCYPCNFFVFLFYFCLWYFEWRVIFMCINHENQNKYQLLSFIMLMQALHFLSLFLLVLYSFYLLAFVSNDLITSFWEKPLRVRKAWILLASHVSYNPLKMSLVILLFWDDIIEVQIQAQTLLTEIQIEEKETNIFTDSFSILMKIWR